MDDKAIIELYFNRDENAIKNTQMKYGRYLYSIANNILSNNEDSEECVNDTYKSAWDTIPPQKPQVLSAYLGKIAKNHAINKYNYDTAGKRNKSLEITLCELEEFLPSPDFADDTTEAIIFKRALNTFLRLLPEDKRNIFILRYWYLYEIAEIAKITGFKESCVKTSLLRLRQKLKKYLEKEGVHI